MATREILEGVTGAAEGSVSTRGCWAALSRTGSSAAKETAEKSAHAADFGTLEKGIPWNAASWLRLIAVLTVRAAPTEIALLKAALSRSKALGMDGKNLLREPQ